MAIVTLSYDNVPADQQGSYLISGWREKADGADTLRTNVMSAPGVPMWPVRDGDTWTPDYVVVTE